MICKSTIKIGLTASIAFAAVVAPVSVSAQESAPLKLPVDATHQPEETEQSTVPRYAKPEYENMHRRELERERLEEEEWSQVVEGQVEEFLQEAKAAGTQVAEEDLTVVDMGAGDIAIEDGRELVEVEIEVSDSVEGEEAQISFVSEPVEEEESGLRLNRGAGSVGYGWTSQGSLTVDFAGRADGTVFSYKTKDRSVWDANTRSSKSLWGYSKKVVARPKSGVGGFPSVGKIYVSAWPTSGSRSKISGWYDYEPFSGPTGSTSSSSKNCDTKLDVSIKFISVPLSDCDKTTTWIQRRGGTDFGPGAMGVEYGQGFFTDRGTRDAGLAMAVKVNEGQTPYWNDRVDLVVTKTEVACRGFCERGITRTCRSYKYAGVQRC